MEASRKEVTFIAENADGRGEIFEVVPQESETRKADMKALADRRRILFKSKDARVGK